MSFAEKDDKGNNIYETYMPKSFYPLLKRNITYGIGDIAYCESLPSWCRLNCITSGKTDTNALSVTSVSEGEQITDGTVVWLICDVKHTLYS